MKKLILAAAIIGLVSCAKQVDVATNNQQQQQQAANDGQLIVTYNGKVIVFNDAYYYTLGKDTAIGCTNADGYQFASHTAGRTVGIIFPSGSVVGDFNANFSINIINNKVSGKISSDNFIANFKNLKKS